MQYLKLLLASSMTILLLAACGGDGGGGSGGGGSVTPTLPAGAVTIDASNADTIATSAVGTLDTVNLITSGVEATALPPMQTAINVVRDIAFNKDRHTNSIVTGVTETVPCDTGSITDNYTSTATSDSGTVTFNSCVYAGAMFNGSFTYSNTSNYTTFDYTGSVNGNITMTITGTSSTIALNLAVTGNDGTGNYSITGSYSVSGGGFGYLVTTQSALTGILAGDISSGSLIVRGANNTRLLIEITSTCSADVSLDTGNGTFVLHTSSLGFCLL